ncbi:hypothetical protein HDU82_002860 [Entophlyctis luteolus]|nr:hypothetical protein HDU82_002860 [Entophlyctis luteolus]
MASIPVEGTHRLEATDTAAQQAAAVEVARAEGTTLATLAQIGVLQQEYAHAALDALIAELVAPSAAAKRPHVLFCFDQANALFSRTAYYDTESRVIDAHRMALLRPFIDVLARPDGVPKAAVVFATDDTHTQTRARALAGQLQAAAAAAVAVPSTTTPVVQQQEQQQQPHSAEEAAAAAAAAATARAVVAGARVVAVPPMDAGEAGALVDGLRRRARMLATQQQQQQTEHARADAAAATPLLVQRLDNDLVSKAVMLTGGNARDLLKYCLL